MQSFRECIHICIAFAWCITIVCCYSVHKEWLFLEKFRLHEDTLSTNSIKFVQSDSVSYNGNIVNVPVKCVSIYLSRAIVHPKLIILTEHAEMPFSTIQTEKNEFLVIILNTSSVLTVYVLGSEYFYSNKSFNWERKKPS